MKSGDKDTTDAPPDPGRDQESRHRGAHRRRAEDDDALVTEVLQKMIKQRRELVELYRKGNREELAAAEEAEIAVIERFLPAQMSDDEARAAIQRDRRRDRRVIDEGHGPGDGRGEGAPRQHDRAGARQRPRQGGARARIKKGSAAMGGGARNDSTI